MGGWAQTLGGSLTRCPRCFRLGWIESPIEEPAGRAQVSGKSSSGYADPGDGRGTPGAEDLRTWETVLEAAGIDPDARKAPEHPGLRGVKASEHQGYRDSRAQTTPGQAEPHRELERSKGSRGPGQPSVKEASADKHRRRRDRARPLRDLRSRAQSFPVVAGFTVLAGAFVGVFLVFPILPDAASDLIVELQQRFSGVFGR